ncbi:MAG: hypothetical protein WBF17_11270, partial [Phycisphaerae bacterium]
MADVLGPMGVVPILVNVGAALLPAIVGAVASVAAVLPGARQLARLCHRKPHVPAILAALI